MIKKIIIALLIISPLSVNAAGINAVFENTPLFSESGIAPGQTVTRTVEVFNNNDSTEDIGLEVNNIIDPENFSSVLSFKINDNSTTYFDGLFSDFVSNGQHSLNSIGSGDSNKYYISIGLNETATNEYQSASLGFAICVGFEGGNQDCDGNVTGGSSGGGSGSGGGGGGGSSGDDLVITNEIGFFVSGTSAVVEWDTNLPSSTQVIYGLKSGGPYILNLSSPNYGYPFSTTELFNDETNHFALLESLIAGETYVFRVVSRESSTDGPNISAEHDIVPGSIPGPGLPAFTNTGGLGGEVLGASVVPQTEEEGESGGQNDESSDGSVLGISDDKTNTANVLFGIPEKVLNYVKDYDCILKFIILLVIALIATFVYGKIREWKNFPKKIRRFFFSRTYFVFILIEIPIVLIFDLICSIWPLIIVALVVFILSVLMRPRKFEKIS